LLVSKHAFSLEIDTTYSAGVGVSDNITRSESNEIDESMGVVGLDFGLTQDSARVRADVSSQFDYVHYVNGTFDDELIGGFSGFVDITLLDERLTWMFQNSFGQQTIDPLTPANPGNREDTNRFSTGPTINLLPGSRNQVRIDLRYTRVDFEERDTDDERMSAALQVGREIQRGARLSLNAFTERVEFDNGGASSDFDRVEGFIRFALAGNRNQLDMDLGYTEIKSDTSAGDGLLVRLNWTRQVSTNTTFNLSGGSSYSDQGNIFQFNQDNSSDLRDTSETFTTDIPFTSNFVNAGYSLSYVRTQFDIGLQWRQEDYKGGPPIDVDTTGANLNFRRDISQSIFTAFGLRFERRDFKYLNTADDNIFATAELGYRFTSTLSLALRYGYTERSGESAVSKSRENRLFLRFLYSPNRAQ